MEDCEVNDKCDEKWVFYRDRPEWSDVTPIPQNDGPYPVVKIAYLEKFEDIYNYFRAVLVKKEISERALKLTKDAALGNSSNYTVWHYRRILLKELNSDLYEELKFIQVVIEDIPKNYQIWYHRQILVEWLNDPSFELEFTQKIFAQDWKNYHAWQHRQWVVKTFNLYDGELEFVNTLLEADIRNNSAWNHRFFIIHSQNNLDDEKIVEEEIEYTLAAILKTPHNESPWSYLRGLLQKKGLSKESKINEFVEKLYENGCRSSHLLAFMIDSIEENLLAGGEDQSLCQKAIQLCDLLAKKHDIIRKEYWNFIARNLGNLYGPAEAHVRRSQSSEVVSSGN